MGTNRFPGRTSELCAKGDSLRLKLSSSSHALTYLALTILRFEISCNECRSVAVFRHVSKALTRASPHARSCF